MSGIEFVILRPFLVDPENVLLQFLSDICSSSEASDGSAYLALHIRVNKYTDGSYSFKI